MAAMTMSASPAAASRNPASPEAARVGRFAAASLSHSVDSSAGSAITGDAPGAILGFAAGYAVSGILSTWQLVLATRKPPILFDTGHAENF